MARTVSDEELQLKKRARRRLVGAIVLVTVVAVVLPMVLDSEPRPSSQSIDIQIPSPDAGVLSSKPAPLKPADAPAVAETPKAEMKAEAKVEAKAETKKTGPKPEAAAEASPAPAAASEAKAGSPAKTKDTPKVKAREPAKNGSFVIQVAALSDAARAKELQAKIVAGGMKAYTEVVQTAKGPVTRVRVGPYASREAAEKARTQLQKLQLDGKVVPR